MITEILKNRFFQNMTRHPDLGWEYVEARLNENKEVLEVLRLMEESGGEPDTIGIDETSGKLIFCDCSSESPAGRRSLCYDDEALQKRKKNPPCAMTMKLYKNAKRTLRRAVPYIKLRRWVYPY